MAGEQQDIYLRSRTQNPLTYWGIEDGKDDLPASRALTSYTTLRDNGLADEASAIMDNLGKESYDASYAKMQALRNKVAAGDSSELNLNQKQRLGSTLQNIDNAMNEIRRQQQRTAENEVFNLKKDAYERAVQQNVIDGTPIKVEDPGNRVWRDVKDVGGQIWHGVKQYIPFFTDEFGNTDQFKRPDKELEYIQQVYSGKQPVQQVETQPAQPAATQQAAKAEEKPAQQAATQQTTKAEEKPAQQSTKAEEKPAQQAQTTQAVQQVIPTQSTQQVYQRPTEPPVKMGANGYPVYEQLPNGGYRYDTTYLDPQGKVDPYAMPNGIRGDFGDQEAYWNLRNRATSAKARYEQSQAANLQGEATTELLQVQADPETHKRAQEYMQSGMALNAQEALNLATVEQAQRMGIWGAAANAYAPMQQSLDNAQTRNTMAGMYYGADTPYMISANGYGAHTGMNGVTFNNDGTVNVVSPTGQVIKGVSADRAMAGVAAGSPQAAAAARYNAVTSFNRLHNGLYGIPGMYGAPTNAAAVSYAAGVSKAFAKNDKQQQPTQSTTYAHE